MHYFGESLTPNSQSGWIIDPFAGEELPQLPIHVAEQFIDMTTEAANRISFASFKEKYPKCFAHIHFWASMHKVYSTVSKFVIQKLIPFSRTWLCETGFSAMRAIKSGWKLKPICGYA